MLPINLSQLLVHKQKVMVQTYQKTSLRDLKIATTKSFSFRAQPRGSQFNERMISEMILSWENEEPKNLVYDEKEGRIFMAK